MAIVRESVGTIASGSGSSVSTNAPSGVAVGDVLILVVENSSSTWNTTTPTGWTQIEKRVDGFSSVRLSIYWRVADGSADDTPTVTLAGSSTWQSCIIRWSGVDTTTPINGTPGQGTSTGGTAPTVPSTTTTVVDCVVVTTITTPSAGVTGDPSSWGTRFINGSTGDVLVAFSKAAPTATAYGGESYTLAFNSASVRITFALNPAAGGGATEPVDVSTAAWTALNATGTPGAVSRSTDAATGAWSALDSVGVAGGVVAVCDTGVGAWSALDATPVAGGVSVSTDTGLAAWTAPDASTVAGGLTVGTDTATAAWSALDASTGGGTTETVDSGVGVWLANAAAAIAILVAPVDTASAAWSANDATAVGGGSVVSVDSGVGVWTALDAVGSAGAGDIVATDSAVAVWSAPDMESRQFDDPYDNTLVDSQADMESDKATIPAGLSTTIRPDALTFDQLLAYTLGPETIGDADSGILGWAWYVRSTGTSVVFARSNDAYNDWNAEQELFTYSGAPIIELDTAFEQNGRIVVVAERATGAGGSSELWIYWFKPSLADFTFERFDDGRTPRVVLDNPNDTAISDVHVAYLKDGVGLLTRRQSELYATPHATVFVHSVDWFLEEFARNRGNRIVAVLSHHVGIRYSKTHVESTLFPVYPIDSSTVSITLVGGELELTAIVHTLYDIDAVTPSILILSTSTLAEAVITDELNDIGAIEPSILALNTSTLSVVVIEDELNDIGSVEPTIIILNTSTLAIVVIEDVLNDIGSVTATILALPTSTLEVV